MRRPANPAHLLKERNTTRLRYCGTRWANPAGRWENSTYASSITTIRPSSNKARTSDSAIGLPVGLFGEQSTINFVEGVRAARIRSTSMSYLAVRDTSRTDAPQNEVIDV